MATPLQEPLQQPTPLMLQFLEQQVEHCCQHELDPHLTREYHKAREVAPELVQRESSIFSFLRVEQWQPRRAAERLCRHWKVRYELFGERWLLPMTQTGTGALSTSDIEWIRRGYVHMVTSPTHGTVAIVDHSRLPESSTAISNARVNFYLQLVCAEESFGEYTVLVPIDGRRRPSASFDNGDLAKVLTSSPVKMKQMIFAQCYEGDAKEPLLTFVGEKHRMFMEHNTKLQCNQYIKADSSRGILEQLESIGFDRNCVPRELGGDVSKSSFDDWVRMRLSLEEIMGAPPMSNSQLRLARSSHSVPWMAATDAGVDDPSTVATVNHAMMTSTQAHADLAASYGEETATQAAHNYHQTPAKDPILQNPGESHEDFIKRRNTIYSRRKYERQKNELIILKGQAHSARVQNEALRAENKRLQLLVEQAQQIVADFQQSTDEKGGFKERPHLS